jgi:hypothetical protein
MNPKLFKKNRIRDPFLSHFIIKKKEELIDLVTDSFRPNVLKGPF